MESYFWLLVRVGLVQRVIEPNWEHLNSFEALDLRELKHEAGWLWLKSMKSTDCDLC